MGFFGAAHGGEGGEQKGPLPKICYKYPTILIPLTFFKSLKIVLITRVTILIMSAKMATLDLLKIKVFLNKGYDVIIFVYDVTNKIL